MWLYWLTSKTVRHAVDVCRHVEKILNAQRDLVNEKGAAEVRAAVSVVRDAVRTRKPKKLITESLANLETVGNKWLKSYPHAAWRENLEVVLVAIAVALAIRTFFLQPFKIPTGSMQPTLFGITSEDLRGEPDMKFPGFLGRTADYWLRGISYFHIVAKEDGEVEEVDPPKTILPFVKRQRIRVGDVDYTIWFPPEENWKHLHVQKGQRFRRGEEILKSRVVTGDHLFVDRLSYNFRHPHRGEIVVFETKGIPEGQRALAGIPGDQFYIKRLVGMGGESLSISNRHIVVSGVRLDASTDHFENVYSFPAGAEPQDSAYSGHVYAGRLRSPRDSLEIGAKNLAVMGDNTVSSLDSRYWGDFPQEYVIGKSFFVYWPILPKRPELPGRFGWGVR